MGYIKIFKIKEDPNLGGGLQRWCLIWESAKGEVGVDMIKIHIIDFSEILLKNHNYMQYS